jgi:acyl-CoA thioesterase-1
MAKCYPLILALILIVTLSGCKRRAERPAAAQKKDAAQGVIVAAGDSLTAGLGLDEEESYPAQLEKKLRAAGIDYRVINAGSSGETSSGLLSRLDWLLTLKPAIVILETGANDGLRGIDPGVTQKNIREAVHRLQTKNIVVILAGMRMVQNLGPEYTSAFNRIYPEIAKQSGVLFMPFFLQGVAAEPDLNSGDAIHPTAEGYRVVANNLYPYVLQAITIVEKRPPAQHRNP